MFLMASCEQGGGGGGADPETPSLMFLPPSNISETGFQLNWSLNTQFGFQSISVDLSEDKEMAKIIKHVETGDISTEYVLISGLQGATPYYYRVSLLNDGIQVFNSEIKTAETSYRMDNFDLVTEDSYTLSSKLAYLESVSGSRPGIILMHEFGVWVNPWIGSDLMKQLVAAKTLKQHLKYQDHQINL